MSSGAQPAAIDERVIRREVGQQRRRADLEADGVGQLGDGERGRRDALGEAAVQHRRRDAIADRDAFDTGADRAHDACDFAAGRERRIVGLN